ncbi:MAG: hypothetical protein ABI426_07910 [Flavobacterium sp.]
MKLLITFVFGIFFLKNYSQTNDIKYVYLHNNNSARIYSDIDIYIYQVKDSAEVYIKTYKSEKKYSISNKKFLNLSNAILKIDPKDVMQDVRTCLDAGDIEIEFSGRSMIPENKVKYSISCLSSEDNKTVWKEYLNAVTLILEIAKLKFSDLK